MEGRIYKKRFLEISFLSLKNKKSKLLFMLGLEALNDVFFSLLISKSSGNQSSQESDKISSIGSECKNSSQASTCVYSDDPDRDEENVAFNQAPFLTRKRLN